MNEIASNYAEALASLAKEKNSVEVFKKEIDAVYEAFNNVDNLKVFFKSVKISKEEKKKLLEDSFKGKINPLVMNFLKVLVDKGRIEMYEDIFKEFHTLANKELGINEGVVESARPLSKEQITKLEKAVGLNVELKPRINTNLISGFRIVMENRIIDNSMREKIDNLSSLLKERS